MNRIIRIPEKEDPTKLRKEYPAFRLKVRVARPRDRIKWLPWLVFMIFISTLIYGSSYLSLFWLPPYEKIDMRSQLTADYNAWHFVVFQPIDPAILEEIKQEEGLPDEVFIDGVFMSTPVAIPTSTLAVNDPASATSGPAFDLTPSSPTTFPTISTSTSIPTEELSPLDPTATPQPAQTIRPGKTRKPSKTPKPPKPANPNKP